MFVGCQALTYCPRRMLIGDADAGRADEYRSPFRNWHERSAVRTAPRRQLTEDDGDRFFFAPELVPVASHPLVRALPDAAFRKILVEHLYRYLDFTAKLESLVVNRTVLGIAHGTVGVEVPAEMRFDAYKIYCDEAYHTLFSADLARQVTQRTRLLPPSDHEPFFLRRLAEIQSEQAAEYRPLVELLFVVISETLISASLAEIPDSAEVVPAVRATVADHAVDEGRHHAYFAIFLRILWSQMSNGERRAAGTLVPRLVDTFLCPDLPGIRRDLMSHRMSADDVDLVIGEVYSHETLTAHRRLVARQTLNYFHDLGAFQTSEAEEQLAAHGLELPASSDYGRKRTTA